MSDVHVGLKIIQMMPVRTPVWCYLSTKTHTHTHTVPLCRWQIIEALNPSRIKWAIQSTIILVHFISDKRNKKKTWKHLKVIWTESLTKKWKSFAENHNSSKEKIRISFQQQVLGEIGHQPGSNLFVCFFLIWNDSVFALPAKYSSDISSEGPDFYSWLIITPLRLPAIDINDI